MAAHRVSSVIAADLHPGIPAACGYAADVDGLRGDCCGPSQASTGHRPATAWPFVRPRCLKPFLGHRSRVVSYLLLARRRPATRLGWITFDEQTQTGFVLASDT